MHTHAQTTSPCTDTYVHTHHIYNHAHMHVHKPMCACGSAHPQVHGCIQAHTLVPPTCTPGCRHMLMHTHAHSEHMDMHTHVCASHRYTHSSPPTCTQGGRYIHTHTHTHILSTKHYWDCFISISSFKAPNKSVGQVLFLSLFSR